MLDPWIIDEIRRREEEERREHQEQRPVLEMPLEIPPYQMPKAPDSGDSGDAERGVVIVEF